MVDKDRPPQVLQAPRLWQQNLFVDVRDLKTETTAKVRLGYYCTDTAPRRQRPALHRICQSATPEQLEPVSALALDTEPV